MKIIDRNGRLFGKISVIDLLVIVVVAVMACALYFKSQQTHTGTGVTERVITFQVRLQGVRHYVADAIKVNDNLYDTEYPSGNRPLGEIIEIQVEQDPGATLATLPDGTAELVESEDTVNMLLTVKGSGLQTGNRWSINRIYEMGVNSSRVYYTRMAQFTGQVVDIY